MYIVVTKGSENEVWAAGLYGDYGKEKAQKLIDSGYYHRYMYVKDRHKELIVIESKKKQYEDKNK